MAEHDLHSFEDFWPFYVRAHANETNRKLHFAGLTLAMGSAALGLLTRRPSLLLAAPVVGYGLSWIGHFVVEGNTPATFGHPLWSLRGDFRMWLKTAAGTMGAEVDRVMNSNGVHAEGEEPVPGTARTAQSN
jgi:hypothetical protein